MRPEVPTCWWMSLVLKLSPARSPQCQVPWQLWPSLLGLSSQNKISPLQPAAGVQPLNSRKPAPPLTPHKSHSSLKTGSTKMLLKYNRVFSTAFCDQCGSANRLHQLNFSITSSTSSWTPKYQTHLSGSTSTTTAPCKITFNKMKHQIYRNLDINSYNNCH